MAPLLSDRQVTRVSKAFVAVLLVVVVAGAAATVRMDGLTALWRTIPSLYVGSVAFLGVWSGRLTTPRYNRAIVLGFLALVASLWEPTAVFGPLLVVPGVVLVVRDLAEQRTD